MSFKDTTSLPEKSFPKIQAVFFLGDLGVSVFFESSPAPFYQKKHRPSKKSPVPPVYFPRVSRRHRDVQGPSGVPCHHERF